MKKLKYILPALIFCIIAGACVNSSDDLSEAANSPVTSIQEERNDPDTVGDFDSIQADAEQGNIAEQSSEESAQSSEEAAPPTEEPAQHSEQPTQPSEEPAQPSEEPAQPSEKPENSAASPSNSGTQSDSNTVTVPKEEETVGDLVWVPVNGGTKYHNKSTCSNMKDPMQVTKETAISNGYEPCKRCY